MSGCKDCPDSLWVDDPVCSGYRCLRTKEEEMACRHSDDLEARTTKAKTSIDYIVGTLTDVLFNSEAFSEAIFEAIRSNETWNEIQQLMDWALDEGSVPAPALGIIETIHDEYCWIPARKQVVAKILAKLEVDLLS